MISVARSFLIFMLLALKGFAESARFVTYEQVTGPLQKLSCFKCWKRSDIILSKLNYSILYRALSERPTRRLGIEMTTKTSSNTSKE